MKTVFSEIGEWIYEQTGIEIPADKQEFEIYSEPARTKSVPGQDQLQGSRLIDPRVLPRIKLDLTADERVVLPPVRAQIFHPYTDAPDDGINVPDLRLLIEAFAEKFRALAERTRPRDLYDVVNLYETARRARSRGALWKFCAPNANSRASVFRA